MDHDAAVEKIVAFVGGWESSDMLQFIEDMLRDMSIDKLNQIIVEQGIEK